jgi:hypothetical protein
MSTRTIDLVRHCLFLAVAIDIYAVMILIVARICGVGREPVDTADHAPEIPFDRMKQFAQNVTPRERAFLDYAAQPLGSPERWAAHSRWRLIADAEAREMNRDMKLAGSSR